MKAPLESTLRSALSLLPDDAAQEALSRMLRTMRGASGDDGYVVPWADFTLDGRFRRGGASDLVHRHTKLAANSREHPDIAALADFVQRETPTAGALHLDTSRGALTWLLPVTTSRTPTKPETSLRALSITLPVFRFILAYFNEAARLSRSEEKVIFQLIAGIDLRQAAELDRVSYETKRMHVKNAAHKLGCHGQRETVQKVLGQLVHLLTLIDADTGTTDIAEDFVSRYLANDCRLTVRRLGNGNLLRVLESGPSSGRRMLMIHGMMFPISLCDLSRHLEDAGIRLLMPIRTGFLDGTPATPTQASGNPIERAIADIALFVEEAGIGPIPVIGISLGAVIATRFATRYPALIEHLVLLSTNLARTARSSESRAGEFYGAMRELTNDSRLFDAINNQFAEYYSDRATCKTMLLSLFGTAGKDRDVLDGTYTGTPAYAMFADLYQYSTWGMTADFVFTMRDWSAEKTELPVPVTVIHGADDPLTPLSDLVPIGERAKSFSITEIAGGGHFTSVSDARDVWHRISRL
ncbi:MAG: hypothetical protein C0606_11635 [Hyphomicrobiales bacterium]|nr:MAG: hypothetical protein C0606_11635 [Hyphomicrobiales bacterium]